jgi:hypothetical protein
MAVVRSTEAFVAAAACVLFAAPAASAAPTLSECLSSSEAAQVSRDQGHLVTARAQFVICGDDACPAVVKVQCAQWLADVDAMLPTVVPSARDAAGTDLDDVRLAVDGKVVAEQLRGMPIALDPGPHVLTFEAGPRRAEVRVVLRAADKNRPIAVELADPTKPLPARPPPPTPPAASRAVPWASIVLAGVGVAALATSALVGFGADSDLSALEAAPCAAHKTCSPSDVTSVKTRFVVSGVGLAAGIVALSAAGILWLTRDPSDHPRAWLSPSGPLLVF